MPLTDDALGKTTRQDVREACRNGRRGTGKGQMERKRAKVVICRVGTQGFQIGSQERFALENTCRPGPVFRPADFTPPSELYAAHELRRLRCRGALSRQREARYG